MSQGVYGVVFVHFVYAFAFGTFPAPAPAVHIGLPRSKSVPPLACVLTIKLKDIYNWEMFLKGF